MASFNKVMLMGNLTRDPQMKYLPSQTAVAEFGIAMNRKFKDASGGDREEVTYVDITAFGRTAEVIQQYFTKGKPIFIEGRLKYDSWEDKNGGGKRNKITVVVDNFQFIGGRDGPGGPGGGGGGGDYNDSQDAGGPPPARPMSRGPAPAQGNRPPAGRPAPQQQAPKQPFGEEQTFNDDDIPF